jgi:hypothetical protein
LSGTEAWRTVHASAWPERTESGLQFRMKPKILIIVRGGMAEPICATAEAEIHIVDQDDASAGGRGHQEFTVDVINDAGFAADLATANRSHSSSQSVFSSKAP